MGHICHALVLPIIKPKHSAVWTVVLLMCFLAMLKRFFLLPLEVQGLHLNLRAERAKTNFHEHIIHTQGVIIRQAMHLLTVVDSMANDQSLRDFQDGEMTNYNSPVNSAPHCLPDDLTEEFYQLPPVVQQYIVSLARETEGTVTSASSHGAGYRQFKKAETTSNPPSLY